MTVPSLVAAGAGGDGTGAGATISYPAGLASGYIAIAHLGIRTSTDTDAGWPGDWTEVSDVPTVTGLNHSWAWRRLDGTETGSISVSGPPGGGVGWAGRMYVFQDCIASGTPYEALNTDSSNSATTYSTAAITTLDADRLAINLLVISDDDKSLAGVTGSNVTWAPTVSQFASPAGADQTLFCQQATVASATTVTAGSESYSGAESWHSFTFALIPAAAAAARQPRHGFVNHGSGIGVFARAADLWEKRRGILVPKLWTPRPSLVVAA